MLNMQDRDRINNRYCSPFVWSSRSNDLFNLTSSGLIMSIVMPQLALSLPRSSKEFISLTLLVIRRIRAQSAIAMTLQYIAYKIAGALFK